MMNPNDPQENPEMFQSKAPSASTQPTPTPPTSKPRVQSEEPTGYGAVRPTDKRPVSREDGDLQQYGSSPARHDNVDRRRRASESAARPARQSAGSDRSFDKSPLHPIHQAKAATGRGGASPAREGKYSYESSHGTPGRSYNSSHGTPGRSYGNSHQPDRAAAVPKFGEWDEKDPQSADNYTYIFNKVRDERHAEPTNPSATPSRPTTRDQQDEHFQVLKYTINNTPNDSYSEGSMYEFTFSRLLSNAFSFCAEALLSLVVAKMKIPIDFGGIYTDIDRVSKSRGFCDAEFGVFLS
nr:RPM1-interacting protein 4 [Ipomoea batatas]